MGPGALGLAHPRPRLVDEAYQGGGGEPPDGMMERIATLEAKVSHLDKSLDGLRSEMKDEFKAVRSEMRDEFKGVRADFRALGDKIDRLPREWAMARVVFYVIAAMMAAATFGPRLISMLTPS